MTYGAVTAACEKAATWRPALAMLQHALQQDHTGLVSAVEHIAVEIVEHIVEHEKR